MQVEKCVERLDRVQIWFCGGCRAVHMNVGNLRIDFDRERFSSFAEAVADIHYISYETPGAFDVVDIQRLEVEGRRLTRN